MRRPNKTGRRIQRATAEQRAILEEWALRWAAIPSAAQMAKQLGLKPCTALYYATKARKRLQKLRSVAAD